jgi:hypothetical protein
MSDIYLDTCVFHEWFVRMIRDDKKEVEYVEFLSELTDVRKYISIFGIAELIESLKKDPRLQGKKITKEWITILVDFFRDTIGVRIIEEDESGKLSGIFLSPKILEFTLECGDLKDSIHVEIAKNNDLLFITKDDKLGELKKIYSNIDTIRSFERSYEKKKR